MGTWARNSSGRWILTGSGRTALVAERTFPASSAFRLQLARPNLNHAVFAMLLASKDGRSGYEVGLVPNAGLYNIVIRSIQFGDPASVAVWATAASGLAVGQPFFLEVRYIDGAIEARLNGATTAVVSHVPGATASPTFAGYKHFGFVSNINGALVAQAQICDLVPQTISRADLLVAACGGDGFLVDGDLVRLLRGGIFNSAGDVSMVEFDQRVYAVDGSHAWVIDPKLLTVVKWTPTAGALPGATADPAVPGTFLPGTTTARFLEVHRGRIWFAGMLEDPQNIIATAVNDPLNLDTGSGELGGAFGLTAAKIGRIGQPVTCIISSTRDSLVIGCVGSVWEMLGDPTSGNPALVEVLKKAGITGKDAATAIAEGQMILHTTAGVYLLPALGAPAPLSASVLTEGIQIDPAFVDNYIVQVRQDPLRNQVYFFLTIRAANPDGTTLHFAYGEKVGNYDPSLGGFEPDDFLDTFGPTASTPEPYRGQVVWGTRHGYLMVLSDDVRTDDGAPVIPRCPLALVDEFKLARECILHKFLVLPGRGSVVKYRVWGALTPEQAYNHAAGRKLLASGTCNHRRQWIDRKVRAPAVVVELYSDDPGAPFEIEEADAVTSAGRVVTQRDLTAAAAPGAPCEPPYYPLTSSSEVIESSDSGPGNQTQFSSAEGTSLSLFTGSIAPPPSSSASIPIGLSGLGVSSQSCQVFSDPLGDQHTICQSLNPGLAPAAGDTA